MAAAMVKHETWTEYVERILDGMSRKDAAGTAGVSEATLSRWIAGGGKKPPAATSWHSHAHSTRSQSRP